MIWKLNGETVAGGHGDGSQLNQLNNPQRIYVDDQRQLIYIADHGNNRIVKWKLGEKEGKFAAPGILDEKKKSLIIRNWSKNNGTIVRKSLENPKDKQLLIANIRGWGLMMTENGDLFVSDWNQHAVKRWRKGEKEDEGRIVRIIAS